MCTVKEYFKDVLNIQTEHTEMGKKYRLYERLSSHGHDTTNDVQNLSSEPSSMYNLKGKMSFLRLLNNLIH